MNEQSNIRSTFYTNIEENYPIAEGVFSLRLAYPADIADRIIPGQFINLYLNRRDLLLPRPISICRVEQGSITIVYSVVGHGTKELSGYPAGTQIRVSTPLGNGYDLSVYSQKENRDQPVNSLANNMIKNSVNSPANNMIKNPANSPANSMIKNPVNSPANNMANSLKSDMANAKSALLVGGGIGIPPLLELAHRLSKNKVLVMAVLGYRDEPFLHDDFENAGAKVYITTDSGKSGYKGNVLDFLKNWEPASMAEGLKADACFACGPSQMLIALAEFCAESEIGLQVSLEERMGCGFGACVGCTCKIRSSSGIVQKKVCKDGPVFWGKEVVWNG